jgi:hypothetical protein
VQSVIKDEMSETQFSRLMASVIMLCNSAFPQHWEKEMRLCCGKYLEQVVMSLSDIPIMKSTHLAHILKRIGWFLHEDGKYQQASELRAKSFQISRRGGTPEDVDGDGKTFLDVPKPGTVG